jgi:Bacterial regulatory proteins, tetR family
MPVASALNRSTHVSIVRCVPIARNYDEAVPVRDVAAAAGVDPAMIRHYFGSKAELFRATMGWPFEPAEIAARITGGDRRDDRRTAHASLLRGMGAPGFARAAAGDSARGGHP